MRETDHFPLSFKESVELLPQFPLQRGKLLKISGIDLQDPQNRLAQIIRQPRDREWIHRVRALRQLPEFGWICCKCFQHCLQNPDPPKKGECKHEVVQIGGNSHQLPMLHCELRRRPLVYGRNAIFRITNRSSKCQHFRLLFFLLFVFFSQLKNANHTSHAVHHKLLTSIPKLKNQLLQRLERVQRVANLSHFSAVA